MKTAETALLALEQQWDLAMVGNDADEIAGFMANDWVIVGADGITTKSAFLESVKSRLLTHNRMDSDEMVVKVYGDAATIISRGTSAGVYDGQPFELYEWSLSVFIRSGAQWQCVATMVTPARPV